MIDLEILYWIFGVIILTSIVFSISLVMFDNTAEQNGGRKLFISSWFVILLGAVLIYLFVYVIKPLAMVIASSVWFSF